MIFFKYFYINNIPPRKTTHFEANLLPAIIILIIVVVTILGITKQNCTEENTTAKTQWLECLMYHKQELN